MNERIKQLAEQAKEETDALYAKLTPQEFKDTYNQKFAELVVREFIDTAFHKGHPDLEFLLKHFGVEE